MRSVALVISQAQSATRESKKARLDPSQAARPAYAFTYIRTGRLWTAVIAHAVTNGMLGVWVVTTGNWQFW